MEPAEETFTSPHRATGWVGLVTMAVALAVTLDDGTDLKHLAFASAVVLFGAVSAVIFLRPELVVHEDHLFVRNSLRDFTIPWTSIQAIVVRYVMEVDAGEQVVRADAFGRSPRQLRNQRRATAVGAEPDYTEVVVVRLREIAAARGGLRPDAAGDGARPAWSWRWLDVSVLAVLALVTVVLVVLA